MQGVKHLAGNHWVALAVSVLVGLIVIAPQVFFIVSEGKEYKGLYLTQTDAEPHYLARMQEALQSGSIGNPFVVEFRNNVPSGFFSYTESLLVAPARIFPISVPDLNLLYKFLLPVLLALLVYSLVVRLTHKKYWGVTASVAVTLGSTAFNFATLSSIAHWSLQYQQFLLFARPVSPICYVIFLFVFLHVLVSYLRKPNIRLLLILGFLFGLSWYLYIYLATLLLSLLCAYGLWHLCNRQWKELWQFVSITGLGMLTGIPALMSLVAITQSPYFGLFVGPIGLESSHTPYIHIPLLVLAVLSAGYWYTHKAFPHVREVFALLLAALVVMNQQVLTGMSLHPGHYITYFCIPIYLIVLSFIAADFFSGKYARYEKYVQALIIAYAVCAAAFIQYSSYVYWAPRAAIEERYMSVLSWLAEHTEPESVVMAHNRLSEFIPAFTKDNVMWEVHANSYLMPQPRWNFTPEHAVTTKDFCAFVHVYRLDYAVWDREQNPDWKLDTKPCLQPITTLDTFTVYRIL